MPETITDLQSVTATIQVTDADNQPTALPAGVVPTWSYADPVGAATMTVAADGMSATFQATGTAVSGATPGQVTVSIALDPNTTITGSDTLSVVASAAAKVVIGFGTPNP